VEFGLDQLAAGLPPGYRSVMEFGFEQVCDQVRAISTCPDNSNLVADLFEAKFHYAILVADLQRAGIWPMTPYLAHKQRASRSATSLGPVCDQQGRSHRGGRVPRAPYHVPHIKMTTDSLSSELTFDE